MRAVSLATSYSCISLVSDGTSQTYYTTYTELRITNPARPERGTASIAADGTTWWECSTRQPPGSQPALSFDSIADTITRALAATAPPG